MIAHRSGSSASTRRARRRSAASGNTYSTRKNRADSSFELRGDGQPTLPRCNQPPPDAGTKRPSRKLVPGGRPPDPDPTPELAARPAQRHRRHRHRQLSRPRPQRSRQVCSKDTVLKPGDEIILTTVSGATADPGLRPLCRHRLLQVRDERVRRQLRLRAARYLQSCATMENRVTSIQIKLKDFDDATGMSGQGPRM